MANWNLFHLYIKSTIIPLNELMYNYDLFQLHSLPTWQYLVPVNCLVEPNNSHLIGVPDRKFIHLLKMEMLQNPGKGAAP